MRSLMVLLLFPLWGLCAPPVPSATELVAPVGEPTLLTVKVEDGKKLGTTKTYEPTSLLFARLWTDDPSTYEFWVFPKKTGTYYLPLWTEGETVGVSVKVIAGSGQNPPPVEVDPDEPEDPPAQGGKFYFVLVRKDGVVGENDPVKASIRLPAWEELRTDGHQVVERTRTELESILRQSIDEDAAAYKFRLDGYVGKVVVLRISLDGKSSSFNGVKPLPADGAAVKELVK